MCGVWQVLGGLLSTYALSGDRIFLEKADDLATKMLLRLMDRHSVATKYVESALETVVNRGLPTMNFGIDEVVFNISHLLAALAPHMADKLSRLNVVPRVVRLLLLEMDLAARVAQNRFRVMRKRRQMRGSDLPVDVRMRQKMMQNMKTDDLNAKWRALKRNLACVWPRVVWLHPGEGLSLDCSRSCLEGYGCSLTHSLAPRR